MDAKLGVLQFLVLPAMQGHLSKEAVDKAIEIAGSKSPSSAFDVAGVYARMQFVDQMKALGFAKGVRWLAIVRRDDGQDAFEQHAKELKELFK